MRLLNLLGIRLLALIGRLPARRAIGRWLGLCALRLAHRRVHIADVNLALTQPDLSPSQRQKLLHRHFIVLGHWLMDTLWALSATPREIKRFVTIEGEIPDRCIVLTPHFAGLELGLLGLNLSSKQPVAYHYKPLHNKFWDQTITYLRQRFGSIGFSTRSKYSLLAAVRHCRRGGILFYLPDINTRDRKSTLYVPFMGVEKVATTTGLFRLAKAARASIVFAVLHYHAQGYTMKIIAPSEQFSCTDLAADATLMNTLIAEQIRQNPENYFWLHRRFKTDDKGQTAVYD